MDQDLLIQKATKKLHQQKKKFPEYLDINHFSEKLDKQLTKLVVYGTTFGQVKSKSAYEFPQFGKRITPFSMAYRWNQLHLLANQQTHPHSQQESSQEQQFNGSFFMSSSRKNRKNKSQNQINQEKLDLALSLALELQQQQQEQLILYRPRFIVDNEYKLQRQQFDFQQVQSFMNNKPLFQFGQFKSCQFAGAISTEKSILSQQNNKQEPQMLKFNYQIEQIDLIDSEQD